MASIEINDITKRFGRADILRGVSLSVESGEFLTILGPSGCGKSTLLRILAGLETQDSGTLAIAGRSVDGTPPKMRDVAMVFQSYALYPHMTVRSNMALPLKMRRLSRLERLAGVGSIMPRSRAINKSIDADVERAARALDIETLLDRKPGQLSGGQRQRVALGRAMVREPSVFLMDEPLSNLDAKLRVHMRTELKALHRRLGATFIYVTHDQSEAMTLSDRVAVMSEGRLLQVAPPRDIYEDPADRRVAEFVGAPKINLFDGRVEPNGSLAFAGLRLEHVVDLPAGTQVSVGLRPEALTLVHTALPHTIKARVSLVEHMGPDVYVHAYAPAFAVTVILRLAVRETDWQRAALREGDTVNLNIDVAGILLFSPEGGRISRNGPIASRALQRKGA